MEKGDNKANQIVMTTLAEIRFMNEDLVPPLVQFTLDNELCIEAQNGAMYILPKGTSLYVHPGDFGWRFADSLTKLLAEAAYKEETRIASMTDEQRVAWLADFIPF